MLLDDVNSLLDGDFGDDRILKQIARACKNNEVISNYERNYVQKLAEQHLGRKPQTSQKSEITEPEIPKIEIPKPKPLLTQTSSSSYVKSDLISINGVSENSNVVNLSILNSNNELVWAEQVSVKSDGSYSTLAIADGEGWENSGTYNIKVEDGTNTKSTKFSFNS